MCICIFPYLYIFTFSCCHHYIFLYFHTFFIVRPPLHKGGGGLTFSKLMEMGAGLKIFARKGGVRQNGGLPYYIEVFLEIPHDAA